MRAESLTLLREKLGVEVVDALSEMIEEKIEKFGVTKEEHREILSRLDGVENRLVAVESRVERLEREIDSLRGEISELRREMGEQIRMLNERIDRMGFELTRRIDELNSRIDELNARMDSMIRWTIGTISLFGVIITAVMVILKLFG